MSTQFVTEMEQVRKIKFSGTLIYYLLKLFLPVFFVALIFFVMVLELGDLFYNIVTYMENNVPFKTILKIMMLYAPKCISFSAPISMLFAGSYTLGSLYANKELTVVFLSGVSLLRFVIPLLVFSFLTSVGMFFFEDRLVIKTLAQKNNLLQEAVNAKNNLDTSDVSVLSDSGKVVYAADYYDNASRFLNGVKIVHRNDEGFMDIVIIADTATWNEATGYWDLNNARTYNISDDNKVTRSNQSAFDFLTERTESFQSIVENIDEMNAFEAKEFLEKLKRRGTSQTEYLVKYYQRFSFPFTIFIVLFLSISFGSYLKKNVLLMSLLLSLSFAVLYYVSQMCMAVLASWNILSPIVGAWLPFAIFLLLSIYLVQTART